MVEVTDHHGEIGGLLGEERGADGDSCRAMEKRVGAGSPPSNPGDDEVYSFVQDSEALAEFRRGHGPG